MKKLLSVILAVTMFFTMLTGFTACTEEDINDIINGAIDILTETEAPDESEIPSETKTPPVETSPPTKAPIDKNGSYFDRDNVALYIRTYGKLPTNFITKADAETLGWKGGNVRKYAQGMAIGGDTFGNLEKRLPTGKKYWECDIDTDKLSDRGEKRIVFSKDGHIYYTDDHYKTFVEYQKDGTWK